MPLADDMQSMPSITVKGRPSENGRTRKDGTPRKSFNMRIVVGEEIRLMQHKVKGETMGLGMCAFCRVLFETNEGLPIYKKMTDGAILEVLKLEFPHSKGVQGIVKGRYTIGKYRGAYNRGDFSNKRVPLIRSHRWNREGELLGKTGRPLRGHKRTEARAEVDKSIAYMRRVGTIEEVATGQVEEGKSNGTPNS